MRNFLIIAVSLLIVVSCKQSNPSASKTDGVIIASVIQSGNLPEPGKQIELVEKRDTQTTDINGQVVFVVPEGSYTVRAFGLNHGGPTWLQTDSPAVVKAGYTTRIAYWDCPLCQ